MRAAAEAARAANHSAYGAPRDPSALYDRVGALHDLTAKLEQLVRLLGRAAAVAGEDPPDGLYSTASDMPESIAGAAAAELAGAAELVAQAGYRINAAWSLIGTLGLDPVTDSP